MYVMYRHPTGLKVTRAQRGFMFLAYGTPGPCPVTRPRKGLGIG